MHGSLRRVCENLHDLKYRDMCDLSEAILGRLNQSDLPADVAHFSAALLGVTSDFLEAEREAEEAQAKNDE